MCQAKTSQDSYPSGTQYVTSSKRQHHPEREARRRDFLSCGEKRTWNLAVGAIDAVVGYRVVDGVGLERKAAAAVDQIVLALVVYQRRRLDTGAVSPCIG